MAKQKIKIIPLDPVEKQGCVIYGLVSGEPDYKISLALNSSKEFSLRADSPVPRPVSQRKNESRFSRFSDISSAPHSWAALVSNRSENQVLVRKMANADFLFLFMNQSAETGLVEKLLSDLRARGLITGFFLIESPAIDDELLNLIIPHF